MIQTGQSSSALRSLLFAVDASEEALEELLLQGWQQTDAAELGAFVEGLVADALRGRGPSDSHSEKRLPQVFAAGITLAAIRVEHSTPFTAGDDSHRRQTQVDVEQPLLQNPGGSAVLDRLRLNYQTVAGDLFDTHSEVRRFAARVLFSPTTKDPLFASGKASLLQEVELVSDESSTECVRLPDTAASRWMRVIPQEAQNDDLSVIHRQENHVFVPISIVRAKFQEYAKHSFDRLVHTGFHLFRDWRRTALKNESWGVEKEINDTFQVNRIRRLYGTRRYDTGGSDQSSGFSPAAHHHQLVNIVDTIRSSTALTFDEFHTASEIYDETKRYFPPPHRPENSLWSPQRIAQVLRSAADATGTTNAVVERREIQTERGSQVEYSVTEPRFTPIYTPPVGDDTSHRWEAYRIVRADYATSSLTDETTIRPAVRAEAGTQNDPLDIAKRWTDRVVATHPHTRPLESIEAAARPEDIDVDVPLSWDEITFLTRVVVGLNGFISGYSLVDGMRAYLQNGDSKLDVDPDELTAVEVNPDETVLSEHDKPYPTLYSVHPDVVAELNLETVSQEGYGESGEESALHRYGTALKKRAIEERPEVDETIRYVDLWRFDIDVDVEQVASERGFTEMDVDTINQRRADVIGLMENEPHVAGEVHLYHGKRTRAPRNWEKLCLLNEVGVEPVWLMRKFDELEKLLKVLQRNGCVSQAEFPKTTSIVTLDEFFDRNDLYNCGIADFSTFNSTYQEVNEP